MVMSPNDKGQDVVLTGSTNFISWRRETYIYLAGKALEGHIDGDIEEPMETSPDPSVSGLVRNKSSEVWRKWRQNDMKCVDKIRKRLSNDIRDTITITAKELWDLLATRYGESTGYTRWTTLRELSHMSDHTSFGLDFSHTFAESTYPSRTTESLL
ncbi:unnamed protein product [Aphanomyces euteiches]